MTDQDVDTEYSEAGHTPTETDYYYEETVPVTDGEVVGQEENPVQVKKENDTPISDKNQEEELDKEAKQNE